MDVHKGALWVTDNLVQTISDSSEEGALPDLYN